MNGERFNFEGRARMRALVDTLIDRGVQFAVTPTPDDIKSTAWDGWLVSWPNVEAAQAPGGAA